MTIHELVQKQGDIEALCVRLREITKPASEALADLDSHAGKALKDNVDTLRQALFAEQAALNEAREVLIGYSTLLDSIMRTTEVEWPPKCSTTSTSV